MVLPSTSSSASQSSLKRRISARVGDSTEALALSLYRLRRANALELGRGLHELLRQLLKPDYCVALRPWSVRCHQREFLDTGVTIALEVIGLDWVGVR